MYLVKWKQKGTKGWVTVGGEFCTPEEASDYIRQQVLEDFRNGLSGEYKYKIKEGRLF